MTKALCYDQATTVTGWCFGTEKSDPRPGNENSYQHGLVKVPKRDEFGERLAHLWRAIAGHIEKFEPDVIGYEEPFFPMQGAGGLKPKQAFQPATGFLPAHVDQEQGDEDGGSRFNPDMLKKLQMVKGVIITQAALRGIPVLGCTSSQWRATFIGMGRAPKGETQAFMKKAVLAHAQRLGFDVVDDNESDAIGICWHTLHGKEAAARSQGNLFDMARNGL